MSPRTGCPGTLRSNYELVGWFMQILPHRKEPSVDGSWDGLMAAVPRQCAGRYHCAGPSTQLSRWSRCCTLPPSSSARFRADLGVSYRWVVEVLLPSVTTTRCHDLAISNSFRSKLPIVPAVSRRNGRTIITVQLFYTRIKLVQRALIPSTQVTARLQQNNRSDRKSHHWQQDIKYK